MSCLFPQSECCFKKKFEMLKQNAVNMIFDEAWIKRITEILDNESESAFFLISLQEALIHVLQLRLPQQGCRCSLYFW